MSAIDPRHAAEFNRMLARIFIERAEAVGLRGGDRDDAALTFWVGAAAALRLAGMNDLAEEVAKCGVVDVRLRGVDSLCELAEYNVKQRTLGGRMLNIFSRHRPDRAAVTMIRNPAAWDQ